jgi:hypothetical protein
MIRPELTRARALATTPPASGAARMVRWAKVLSLAALGTSAIGGCVNVTAPDKPIVIELNVNIRQEVIYRLAADADKTIKENEDIF